MAEPTAPTPAWAWRIADNYAAPIHAMIGAVLALSLAGCSLDGLLKSNDLPPNVNDPAITRTPQGALAAYQGVIVDFRRAFGGSAGATSTSSGNSQGAFVAITGKLTDELQNGAVAAGGSQVFTNPDPIDQHDVPEGTPNDQISVAYSALQQVRGQASQALGLLQDYVPDQPALRGHIYALEGYAEVFLAELFCSGIPLSTLDYQGDYTPRPGSTTAEVLQHAVAQFDSALVLAPDSARIVDLARLGKARALLGLDSVVQAAAVVNMVADDYVYATRFGATPPTNLSDDQRNFVISVPAWGFSVADHEGLRGLDYVSSGDPRTLAQAVNSRQMPQKYAGDGSSPIVVASGLEARLIEAEAALRQHDYISWLDKLNYLRQTATFWMQIAPTPGGPLDALDDPGPDGAGQDSLRVDLMFRERAFWLFLTGHREGDLRRLIRQYGRQAQDLYPSGPYPGGGGFVFYGGDVTLPIPPEERQTNPQFTGCASHGA